MTTDVTTADTMRREAMETFIRRTAWSFVLKDTATERWGDNVKVHIAEKGTFKKIPVKAWTHTDTGTIFIREEIFDGIDLTIDLYTYTINQVVRMLVAGEPINRDSLILQIGYYRYVTDADKDVLWRIAQAVTAAYGVFGHEYCHAAYSEHAARGAFQMGLEDLRAENLWMAQDPIRARQGLRACAGSWVAHDSSPMNGAQVFDTSRIQSHSDMLHLYLLIAGRGRIGVLDDGSVLVNGVRELAADVLGWEVTSDADDIIDRFLETSEDPNDTEGAEQRKALAKEFSALLPPDAKPPTGQIGCRPQHQPKQQEDPDADQVESPGNESDEGQGASGDDGDDAQGGDQPGGEQSGDQDGDKDGKGGGTPGDGDAGEEGDETGKGGGDNNDDTMGKGDVDADTQGGTADESDDTDGTGPGSSDDGDTDDGEHSDGPTIGTDKAPGGEDGKKKHDNDSDPDFITGSFGETIRPGTEDVTDELDDSDAFRLTQEQIEALTEILTEGLEEVADDESDAGWGISNEAGAVLISRSTSPAKVASDVFSKQALATRNRRLKR